MMVVQVMKIAHAIMVVQVIKIAHVIMVVRAIIKQTQPGVHCG